MFGLSPEAMMDFAIVVLCLDALLFLLTYLTVRRGVSWIGGQIMDAVSTPEGFRELGRGIAAGWRDSRNGRKGRTQQQEAAEEKALMSELVESWMIKNTPALAVAEQNLPGFKASVKKHPEAAFFLLQKWGPALEGKIDAAIEQAGGVVGKMQ